MSKNDHSLKQEDFSLSWIRLLIQGLILLALGIILTISSIMDTQTIVMSAREFSWLPVVGFIVFLLGLQEIVEAFITKIPREFLQNLQVGILDCVIGGLIIFSLSDSPQRLGLMIAAFLIVRGTVRIVLTQTLHLPNALLTSFLGVLSIVLGFLISFKWPTDAGWFLSFCLAVEIAFRGWAMMMFSFWVRKVNKLRSN
jgi:uncharacterized membrane protein HdeD (DUF308 family)